MITSWSTEPIRPPSPTARIGVDASDRYRTETLAPRLAAKLRIRLPLQHMLTTGEESRPPSGRKYTRRHHVNMIHSSSLAERVKEIHMNRGRVLGRSAGLVLAATALTIGSASISSGRCRQHGNCELLHHWRQGLLEDDIHSWRNPRNDAGDLDCYRHLRRWPPRPGALPEPIRPWDDHEVVVACPAQRQWNDSCVPHYGKARVRNRKHGCRSCTIRRQHASQFMHRLGFLIPGQKPGTMIHR